MATRLRVGALLPNLSSKPTDRTPAGDWLALLALGAAAAALAAAFRWPLHVPGHQGLTWMAVLMFARCAWPRPWGATLCAAGAMAAASVPFLHGHDPLVPVYYLTTGMGVDLLMQLPARLRGRLGTLGLIAAAAFATKPIIQWYLAAHLKGVQGSALFAFSHVLAAHAVFGFVGGLAGAWAGTIKRNGP